MGFELDDTWFLARVLGQVQVAQVLVIGTLVGTYPLRWQAALD